MPIQRASKLVLLLLAAPLLRGQDPALQQAIEQLRQRVADLEEQQARTAERLGDRALVQSYTARSFDLGGHVTSLFTHMRGERDTATGHVVSLLELFLSVKVTERWSAFATPGFYSFNGALLDDPSTPGSASDPLFTKADTSETSSFLPRLHVQWQNSDELQLQGGIVGSPHGTTNREYFIPARMLGQGSLHTRVFLANQLYPQHLAGLRAAGKLRPGDGATMFAYDAYFGSEDDSADDAIGGLRLAWQPGDCGLSIAANYGRGTREGLTPAESLTTVPVLQSPFAADFNGGRDYEFVGLDIDLHTEQLLATVEIYASRENGYDDQRAASAELTWFPIQQLGLTYRFDYYDRGSDQQIVSVSPFTTVVAPLGIATEHVLGVCYDPDPSVRLRLDFHHGLLPRSDEQVDFVNLSWSVRF